MLRVLLWTFTLMALWWAGWALILWPVILGVAFILDWLIPGPPETTWDRLERARIAGMHGPKEQAEAKARALVEGRNIPSPQELERECREGKHGIEALANAWAKYESEALVGVHRRTAAKKAEQGKYSLYVKHMREWKQAYPAQAARLGL